jgi:alginate O-acetyltransferase complex protein AlgI
LNFADRAFYWFFPLVFLVHWGLGTAAGSRALSSVGLDAHRTRKLLMLTASYYFYAQWDARLLSLIIASTTMDFWFAYAMDVVAPARRKALLVASVVANLGLLAYFKYAGFFVDSAVDALNALGVAATHRHLEIILPVGISFYTFQSMSYVIDVYRRELKASRSWLDFYLFVAFFPQLVAGPIVRAIDFLPQLLAPPRFSAARLVDGLELFMIGLFKKLVIADEIATQVDSVYADLGHYSSLEVFLAAVGFCFQIYADFSGYSDMAIGCARMLGYELCENFRLPYLARSVTEYWRRWHISLSTWFRDYLYIPLGGNRHGTFKTYRNLIVTFLLTGLWHGASWTFVMFGAWNGFMLIVERVAAKLRGRRARAVGGGRHALRPPVPAGEAPPDPAAAAHLSGAAARSAGSALRPDRRSSALSRLLWPLAWAWTAASTVVSFIFFRAETMDHAFAILRRIVASEAGAGIFLYRKFLFVAGLVVLYHLLAAFHVRRRLTRSPAVIFVRAFAYTAFLLYMLSFAPLGSRSFIYFQF